MDEGSIQRSADAAFPYSPAIIPGLLIVVDLMALLAAGVVAFLATYDPALHLLDHLMTCVIFVSFVYVLIGQRANLFGISAVMRPMRRAVDIAVAIATALLLFCSVMLALDVAHSFPTTGLLAFAGLAVGGVIVVRQAGCALLRRLSARKVIGSGVVILGAGEQAQRFLRRLAETQPFFVSMTGVFTHGGDDQARSFESLPVLGGIEELLAYARRGVIDDVVVAMPWNEDRAVIEAIEILKELPVNVYLSSDLVGFELAFRPAMGSLRELPLFEVVERPISGWNYALKQFEDYVIGSLALLLVTPLMLLIALAIKLDTAGPVFFMQRRLGFNNREFLIYKFRSMHHGGAIETHVRQATRNDPRVTRVGRIIRATSLDELPQLLNVLNGTMSLVGPRPHALSHNEEYSRQIRGYFARHRVKPGITGWAQVNGLRGETEDVGKMEARIRHDIYYAENWSLMLDIKIMVMTLTLVLFQKSAY